LRAQPFAQKRLPPAGAALDAGPGMAHTSDTTRSTSPTRQQGTPATLAGASGWSESSLNGNRFMHSALSLLFCVALPAAPPGLDNLDFGTGRLTGWQGEGFYLTTSSGHGPGLAFGVCSSDGDRPGRTGLLHRSFIVPPGIGTIHFTAYATPGAD